eukprot:TRINITY_DN10485_c0_g1_i2.p1 TRINITY_DN10485_c0_g1~~TRINITY_DN10485_c0_g1_i2.p1  ORF type:complete len:664 (-),score=146.62 TRINITY_DN10485_c0_g1_i2:58-2049(-)
MYTTRTLFNFYRTSRPTIFRPLIFRNNYCGVQQPFSLQGTLRRTLRDAICKTYPMAFQEGIVDHELPLRPFKGEFDYSSQVPLLLVHKGRIGRNVHEIASDILNAIPKSEMIEKVSSENGVIGISIRDSYLYKQATNMEYLTKAKTELEIPKNVLIDYASPNMAKELHVGHLRSTMIGACLESIFRYKGSHVVGISHVGDFGSPLGAVVAKILEMNHPLVRILEDGEEVQDDALPTAKELSHIYVSAKSSAKISPEFQKKTIQCTLDIQRPSNEINFTKKVWEVVLRASRRGFNEIYSKLGVEVTEKGESSYVDQIPDVLFELKEKGLVKYSNGAWGFFSEFFSSPLLVQTSDGTYLYAATDLAAIKERLNSGFQLLLYVTDSGQKNHFSQIFEVARRAGWFRASDIKVEHVGFGVVTDVYGKKLSSRDGTPLSLSSLLSEAVEETKSAILTAKSVIRAEKKDQQVRKNVESPFGEKELQLKEPERLTNLDKEIEVSVTNAEQLAYNAIIYFELSNSRKSNYKFSFNSMLGMRGNTAMYLLYAYARIRSVLSRLKDQGVTPPSFERTERGPLTPKEKLVPAERNLCLLLLQFPESVDKVVTSLEPNYLCSYLFDLAKGFHHFYDTCRILGSDSQEERIRICVATSVVLSCGLNLLNISALERV